MFFLFGCIYSVIYLKILYTRLVLSREIWHINDYSLGYFTLFWWNHISRTPKKIRNGCVLTSRYWTNRKWTKCFIDQNIQFCIWKEIINKIFIYGKCPSLKRNNELKYILQQFATGKCELLLYNSNCRTVLHDICVPVWWVTPQVVCFIQMYRLQGFDGNSAATQSVCPTSSASSSSSSSMWEFLWVIAGQLPASCLLCADSVGASTEYSKHFSVMCSKCKWDNFWLGFF